ncbi:hypothetical protein L2E82_01725 [Cichorium intybus]|uniref:Uncharacterized protein n=1 Tax=Cichorium intybus TaxID=13427 RepID=A0ACB9H042_CICIN|nr:hypothetical protein L2E82_01725 [Cichorium intybus]
MEMKLGAQAADQTVYEGEGGGYYSWSTSESPLLKESMLGAGKLLLHPLGFALPHYADSSKIGYVLQGTCTVGLVAPHSSEEKVAVIKKGDVIPLPRGVVSWWFNGGETDLTIVFMGETTKAQVPGEFTYFFMAGLLGILRGFQSDFVANIFGLSNKDAEDIATSQPGVVIVKLKNGIEFPNPSEYVKEKLYAAIDTPTADVVVKGGGIVNSLTEKDFPMLAGMGLSARFIRLQGKAMLAPSYVADGSVQIIYVAKGSGRIRVVGADGNPSFDGEVGEGELMVVPQFFAVTVIADEGGMELFSIINTSMPVFEQLAGKDSVWKAISPVVLQSALNISSQLEHLFRSKNTKTLMIIPPRS